jgi:hypothetical protein
MRSSVPARRRAVQKGDGPLIGVPDFGIFAAGGGLKKNHGGGPMRAVILSLLVAVALVPAAAPAAAGVIERACLSSDRGGSRALCGCIQRAADRTLSGSDQRKAARFFRDPDEAQKIRMSDRRSDKAFWERYTSFGYFAEVSCSAS